jgi:NAD+ kinase
MSKTLGILANALKPQAIRLVRRIILWAERHGHQVALNSELMRERRALGIDAKKYRGDRKKSDLILALGGDGVLLHAATTCYPCRAPILAVNLGSLGFNAQTLPRGMFQLIEDFFAGNAKMQLRCMLMASVFRGGRRVFRAPALNDVLVEKDTKSRIISLGVRANGAYVTDYRGDGLIISTPTGSTAYNLGVGGPILYPSLDVIVLSAMCPHALTNRPLLLPADTKLDVVFEQHKDRESAVLATDGQRWQALRSGDRVEVVRAAEPLRLVLNPDWDYFQALREKLHWGGSLHV